MSAQPSRPLPRPEESDAVIPIGPDGPFGADEPDRALLARLGSPPVRTLLLGLAGSVLMLIGAFGSGGTLLRDPVLGNSPLSFWRYGHGSELAGMVIYLGLGLFVWAWIRLGRDVLARRVGGRAVLVVALAWAAPLLVSPPLFTRDPFSYLAQGALPLAGFDPYAVGPDAMGGVFTDNVHYFWQDTPAPYGPLFILLAKGIVMVVGSNAIAGVLLMRLLLAVGLVLLIIALPDLSRRMGGRPEVALWVAVANPVTIVHMIGGGHNDLLVMGLMPCAALLALRKRFVWALTVATLAMAIKASAGILLPFLVLIWAATLTGPFWKRLVQAALPSLAVFGVVFAACSVAAGVGLGWLPALSAPSMIVNWLSLPTGAGQLAHTVARMFGDPPEWIFVNGARALGGVLLVWLLARHWWRSRDGGPDAIRRAGIVLAFAAVLSPATLPWYLSWGFCLLAMAAWSGRGLQWLVVGSLWMMTAYYPTGETALYDWGFIAVAVAASALAAVSLLHPDPLHLGRRRVASDGPAPPAPAPDDLIEPLTDSAVRRPG